MTRGLGVVLLALIGALACKVEADFSDAMPEVVVLSAEEYRQEIVEIDRLVFTRGRFDETRRRLLAEELEGLARRMKASSDSRFIAIEALELRRLAAVAKRAPEIPPTSMIANQWMRIRNNVFDDRAWFARSAADLEAAPPSAAASGSDESSPQPAIGSLRRTDLDAMPGACECEFYRGSATPEPGHEDIVFATRRERSVGVVHFEGQSILLKLDERSADLDCRPDQRHTEQWSAGTTRVALTLRITRSGEEACWYAGTMLVTSGDQAASVAVTGACGC